MFKLIHWILNYYHQKGYVIDAIRDNFYSVLLFKQPVTFLINGETIDVSADYCIIYEPKVHQYYYNNEAGYYHDGVFFSINTADSFFKDLDIMCNIPFPVKNPTELSDIIREIASESMLSQPNSSELIDLHLRILMLKLKNAIFDGKKELHHHAKDFHKLRQDIYTFPEKQWNAEAVATDMYMSLSRFHHLYKDMLSTTFKQDIIQSRIKRAKHLLRNENNTIKEISDICGYNNEEHFLRQFKKITGVTPGDYRETVF